MRLNHLEIAGFKSFPERAALAFDDGVTAIVGPNGCGKSNVIDAITWVLGEQSARSLRGERMEDVIFSGSDGRRPTATAEVRIQLAEVTAALTNGHAAAGRIDGGGPGGAPGRANGDAPGSPRGASGGDAARAAAGAGPAAPAPAARPETAAAASGDGWRPPAVDDDASGAGPAGPVISRDIEVARRLYRSGESEYLIDGQVCRLRDIQDLLMDAGVGVKAYAVIEQGRIGQMLGARPTERRQLIEEAAGVTKYRTRRRAAELKLDAAQQNLTRVDDIVFEVEKQRTALKRQASRARRYRRLREEHRRWQKIVFTRRSRTLEQAIAETVRRLTGARLTEQAAAAAAAEVETTRERLRIELAEAERSVTALRETAHRQELEIERTQQQIDFDTRRAAELETEAAAGADALDTLEQRRQPVQTELTSQQQGHARCLTDRDAAFARLQEAERAFTAGQRTIEGREGDVEATRSEIFAVVNAAAALQHVIDNAAAARERSAGSLAKLDTEAAGLDAEADRLAGERTAADRTTREERARLESVCATRTAREAELASARDDVDRQTRALRDLEQQIAGRRARVESLEAIEASRSAYGDAVRGILAEESRIAHHGTVADHLDVDATYEAAVEACLADHLQDVVVPSLAAAREGAALAASQNAGRCGFVIADAPADPARRPRRPHRALRPLSDVVTVAGPGAAAVTRLLHRRWLAASLDDALAAADTTLDPIGTPDGVVVRGRGLLRGGAPGASRLLGARREIKTLRARIAAGDTRRTRLVREIAAREAEAAAIAAAIETLQADAHASEKRIVGLELQAARLQEDHDRVTDRRGVVEAERRQWHEEQVSLDAKEAEARDAVARLEVKQRSADERFTGAERSLLEARETVEALGRAVTGAKADHAALSERVSALAADVRRIEAQAADLDQRIAARREDNARAVTDRTRLLDAVAASTQQLDAGIAAFEALRTRVAEVDAGAAAVRERMTEQDQAAQAARRALDQARAEVGRHEATRAAAEADAAHLAESCLAAVQTPLPEVRTEIEALEAEGPFEIDTALIRPAPDAAGDPQRAEQDQGGPEPADPADDPDAAGAGSAAPGAAAPPDADDVVDRLRARIDRLGPVNMMAIEQFDELEERHVFLTTQRQDLLDAIASTGEAIKRIDATTRVRFQDAFTAVNEHFQRTFETLFGGGRAGLVLIDESDVLESGIDIIAQPPGKRLQSIQLLSGGEKALTAMALMFAIFRYRPSPFCLLDEIDAPLDDANIGRFVEMLRGLLDHTQFVLVTHNRKTMEIADRLYGITMEEPGVSKLISVNMA